MTTFNAMMLKSATDPIHLLARPGVFAWDRLDAGTQVLLDAMRIGVGDRVLDLGCGCGIIGVAAAMLAPQGEVLMLDADINAVVSARQTVAANNIENAEVVLSDCSAVVENQDFDVVVTNPPFHQGKATQYDAAYQFIRDAARLLKSGGRFYLVANRFLPYEDTIRQWLGHVDTIHEDRRFKVLLGRKQ
jgi:16S rRNA (guanine1207-N2)-methyltransferase